MAGIPVVMAAPDAKEQAWYRRTYVESYEKAGVKNAKWDAPAKGALEAYVALQILPQPQAIDPKGPMVTQLEQAREAGCTDPYLQYLFLRFLPPEKPLAPIDLANAANPMAAAMKASSYPAYPKFWVTLRASDWIKRSQNNSPPIVQELRMDAMKYLNTAMAEPDFPAAQVDQALQALYSTLEYAAFALENAGALLEPQLTNRYANLAASGLFLGRANIKAAWNRRGGGFANKVTEEGWKGFRENMAEARKALERAWSIDNKEKRIAAEMINVERAAGGNRAAMEKWFERAMALDPSYYDACNFKLFFLAPRWHGSEEEMIKFGRECVDSKKWTGQVPLILVDAHDWLAGWIEDEDDRKDYWKQADVWTDIDRAYKRYSELNPTAKAFHRGYALYAYRCEQWKELDRQLGLLESPIDYEYFGGRSTFDRMVRKAAENRKTAP